MSHTKKVSRCRFYVAQP